MGSAGLALGVVLMLSVSGELPQSRVRRVIGGKHVKDGQWPWLVKMHARIPTRYFWGIPIKQTLFQCTASLLNEWWVLTAAHCMPVKSVGRRKALTAKYYTLKLGDMTADTSFFEKVRGFFGMIMRKKRWQIWNIRASKIIMHPKYDGHKLFMHDIALIKLSRPAPTGKQVPNIKDVKLPQQGDSEFPVDNAQCVAKGWGCTKLHGQVSHRARATILPKLNDDVCRQVYGVKHAEMRVCAGHFDKGKGICPGDSGGPLVCKDSKGDWVQVGVASFTSGSRPGKRPGVYARVSYYMNWIRDTMNKN